ncbi:hypothetical protein JCM8097_004191 [Rhodosporidiobolus ruineniae]
MPNEALPEHAYYCFEAIHARLQGTELPSPPFDADEEFPLFVTWNIQSRSSGEYRLRGCIGNFGALRLGDGLSEYACTSAFDDERFGPITAKELPRLECGVSLLTDFEQCVHYLDWEVGTHGIYVEFANPALSLPPSVLPSPSTPSSTASSSSAHLSSSSATTRQTYRSLSALPKLKLSLTAQQNPKRLPSVLHATFLPEVAPAQGWSKVDAVDAAMRKAGFRGQVTEDMRRRAKVSRYQSKKVKVDYGEWQDWRKAQGHTS